MTRLDARRGGRALALALGLTVLGTAPTVAWAQDAAAEAAQHYEKGMSHYNLGRFDDAVKEFSAAFELQPEPVLLYNIAQAYRQKGAAEQAIFFYKRYLALDPRAKNRGDVEKRIKELEDIARRQASVKDKPPTEIQPSGKPTPVTPTPVTPTPATPTPVTPTPVTPTPVTPTPTTPTAATPTETAQLGGTGSETISAGMGTDTSIDAVGEPAPAKRIRASVAMGPMFPKFTSAESDQETLPSPTLFGLAATGSYGFPVGPVTLDAGAQLSFGNVPWDNDGTTGSSKLVGLVVGGAARYPVHRMVDVRGGLYGGITWWTGLAEGNPFTSSGQAASGAVPMPTFRFDVGADVKVWNDLYVTGGLMGSFASTTSQGLKDRVSGVRYIDVLVGVGYAL